MARPLVHNESWSSIALNWQQLAAVDETDGRAGFQSCWAIAARCPLCAVINVRVVVSINALETNKQIGIHACPSTILISAG
jgi:hypothetical protein